MGIYRKSRMLLLLASFPLLAGCSRTGYTDNSSLVILGVEASKNTVVPGESMVPVTVEIENLGRHDARILGVQLSFRAGASDPQADYQVHLLEACPCLVATKQSIRMRLGVNVSLQASAGAVEVDASAQVQLVDDTVVTLVGAQRTGGWEVLSGAEVEIPRVTTDLEEVSPGQSGIGVAMQVENRGSLDVEIVTARLMFFREETDVTWDYRVTFDPDNPAQLSSGSGASLAAVVDVSIGAATGTVLIDAQVEVRLAGSPLTYSFRGALETDGWEVISTTGDLTVTTAEDEDDTGGFPSVEAAGGPQDLSLREALIVANDMDQPVAIRFAPEVFPLGQSTKIELSDDLGALPEVVNPGTRIDGSGADVSLVTSPSDPIINGLTIRADDVTIQGLSISGFNRSVIDAYYVDRLHLLDCHLGWGGNGRGLVEISGGEGHVVSNCSLRNANAHGLWLRGEPQRVVVSGNQITSSGQNGLRLGGYDIEISDNLIQGSGYSGIVSIGLIDSLLRNNQILSNGISTYSNHGLFFDGNNAQVLVESNQFTGNFGDAIRLDDLAIDRITISACGYEGNELAPIHLATGANSDILPPAITTFDGLRVEGTADSEGGLVEVYSVESSLYTYLDHTEVTGGAWSLDLAETQSSVAATITAADGSSSAFCSSFP